MPLLIVNEENEGKRFRLSRQECLELELVFNKCEKGKEWRDIGDKLYNFYVNKSTETLVLNNAKYSFLLNLTSELLSVFNF